MQNFDEIQECPHCHTNKELKSDLQFLFSECCGYALCESCTSQIFSKNTSLRCPNCNETVNKKKYSKNRLSTQQFQNEASKRTSIHKACNLRKNDFETLSKWNDYLEFVEDLVYDLSHGTGQERKAAEERLKKWKIKNHEKIERNRDLEYQEQMKASDEKENGLLNNKNNNNKDNDGDISMNNNLNNNINNPGNTASIHPVFSHMLGAICIDRNDSPNIPNKLLKDAEKLKKRRQKAAGFINKTAQIREKSEVLSGLFLFPQLRNNDQ